MQNARLGNPSFQDRSKSLPPLPGSLTTTDQYIPPQPVDASLKDAQLIDVAGHSMVLVIARHN